MMEGTPGWTEDEMVSMADWMLVAKEESSVTVC